jgi:hypothetical protein
MGTTWLGALRRLRQHKAYRQLDASGRVFVDTFLSELVEIHRRKGSAAGDRNVVAAPFTKAVRALVQTRGLSLEEPKTVGRAHHPADITFRHRERLWVVEIKTGAEFNSIGAAQLGALAYKALNEPVRFVLLSLYSKLDPMNVPHDPANEVRHVLRCCDAGGAIDHVHVLSRPVWKRMSLDSWCSETAIGVSRLCRRLPKSR